jgi:predicted PurR-regulated permease PerM
VTNINLSNKIWRILAGILAVILLVYVIWTARNIILYFLVAVFIAFLGRPLYLLLDKVKYKEWQFPNWLKSVLVIVSLIIVIGLFFRFTIPTIFAQAEFFASIDVVAFMDTLSPKIQQIEDWLYLRNIKDVNLKIIIQEELSQLLDLGNISDYIRLIISALGDTLIAFFSILFISFFLLKDGKIMDDVVMSLTPDKFTDKVRIIIEKTKNLLTRYLVGIVLQIIIIMALITIGLTFIGVNNALFIGVLAGIFNVIPYLGPIIGGLLGITLSITTKLQIDPSIDIVQYGLMVMIPFVIAQMVDNFVLQPLIFSKSVKAHPLEIFIVILVAGNIGGLVGMILAVPVYTFIRIVSKEFFNGYKVVQGLTKDL